MVLNSKKDNVQRKIRNDKLTKIVIFTFSSLSIIALLLMFFFILKEAFPAYKEHGFFKMYFTTDFTQEGNWGIWGPLFVTLFTSILAVMIALPISLRASFFIHFRIKKHKRFVKVFINILAGAPSIIFGLFAFKALSTITGPLIGVYNGATIFNSIIMLVFMIIPTITALILNQLKTLPTDYLNPSIALGKTKTFAIYSVAKKEIRQGIFVASIMGLGRAIGETMALSILLLDLPTTGSTPLSDGFFDFLRNGSLTLGVAIASTMFDDAGTSKNHLFAAGVALFIIVMLLVITITHLSKRKLHSPVNPIISYKRNIIKKRKKLLKGIDGIEIGDKTNEQVIVNSDKIKNNGLSTQITYWLAISKYYSFFAWKSMGLIFQYIGYFFNLVFSYISYMWSCLKYFIVLPISKHYDMKFSKDASYSEKFIHNSNSLSKKSSDYFRISIELFSILIILGFVSWFSLDILINGMSDWTSQDFTYLNKTEVIGGIKVIGGKIMNPIVWTLMLILITILIATPFSIGAAIYLSEYAKDTRMGKTIRFFIDSLGGTPSIIFGLFGSIFFIGFMGMSNGNSMFSFIAGALTMVLVVIPTFTRSVEQVLVRVPDSLRNASYALGASKTRTIFKVVIPQSISGIISGVVLSSGRIIAETAPIFLTLGYFASTPQFSMTNGGHTITTAIWNVYKNNTGSLISRVQEAYSLAAAAFMMTAFIVLFSEAFEPLFIKSVATFKKIKVKIRVNKNKGMKEVKSE